MVLDHLEISVATGTITQTFAADLNGLLEDVFGWTATLRTVAHPKFGDTAELSYAIGSGFRLIVRETSRALQPGLEDHLGFTVDPDEFGRLTEACLRFASQRPRVELSYLASGLPMQVDLGDAAYKTFFVRFLLPVWFQFETTEKKRPSGGQP
jgi:hypothetical protein